MSTIKNGSKYPKALRLAAIAEYKKRSKSKTGVTYTAIAREFNTSWQTIKGWVLDFRPEVSAQKRPNGCLSYHGILFTPNKTHEWK